MRSDKSYKGDFLLKMESYDKPDRIPFNVKNNPSVPKNRGTLKLCLNLIRGCVICSFHFLVPGSQTAFRVCKSGPFPKFPEFLKCDYSHCKYTLSKALFPKMGIDFLFT